MDKKQKEFWKQFCQSNPNGGDLHEKSYDEQF